MDDLVLEVVEVVEVYNIWELYVFNIKRMFERIKVLVRDKE